MHQGPGRRRTRVGLEVQWAVRGPFPAKFVGGLQPGFGGLGLWGGVRCRAGEPARHRATTNTAPTHEREPGKWWEQHFKGRRRERTLPLKARDQAIGNGPGALRRITICFAWGFGTGLCLRGGGGNQKRFVTPTGTNIHGDALCFMVKTRARHNTTETVLNNVWRLVTVGSWWRLAVGGGWWSLGAVLKGFPEIRMGFLRTALV